MCGVDKMRLRAIDASYWHLCLSPFSARCYARTYKAVPLVATLLANPPAA